jgi:prepilin-type N-terminal cleavage/methylation domain-containing protein
MKNVTTNKTARKAGFTLVEIMIVVAIIGLLAAIAIPNFIRARTTSQANACINNLRQFDGAKQQWALEQKQLSTATPATADISPYIKLNTAGSLPPCPAGGSYTLGAVSVNPTCNIANTTTPGHVLP